MKTVKSAIQLLVASLALPGLLACQKQEVAQDEKGPAEKAGQQIDQAAARASQELSKATEKAGEGLQALGQKIQDTAQKAQDSKKSE
ncbi:MAG TPA: hypothetical protein VJ654_20565 [Noviherbaspirillum sp.]|nr:hypothetical protein [Noviherbaspirillum sp.]